MRFRCRKPHVRWRALKRWHNWFCWHPVRVPTSGKMSGMTIVWLETVMRQGHEVAGGLMEGNLMAWRYKFIKRG